MQQNFPIKTGETAFLFLQHFIKSLKAGGRAGIVIKNTFLFNTDNASVARVRFLRAAARHCRSRPVPRASAPPGLRPAREVLRLSAMRRRR